MYATLTSKGQVSKAAAKHAQPGCEFTAAFGQAMRNSPGVRLP